MLLLVVSSNSPQAKTCLNAMSWKSLEIQASAGSIKTKNQFGAEICMKISFQLLLQIMKIKS